MPIKGLTDRGMMFPEIGSIRKGGKKPETGNAPGRDLTFFRVEIDDREKESIRIFNEKYGSQPVDINILLPFNEIEKCWDAYLEAYNKGHMIARSDGEKYLYKVNSNGVVEVMNSEPYTAYSPDDVFGEWIDRDGKKNMIKCRPVGRLKVVIPELARLAYLTLHTTSIHDIRNIQAQLEAISAINGGRMAGIPLVLRRRPKKISTKKPDGTTVRYEKWMISIEADPEFVKAALVSLKTSALPGNGLNLLPGYSAPELPEHTGEIIDGDPDYGEDEQPAEWGPEPVDQEPAIDPEPAAATHNPNIPAACRTIEEIREFLNAKVGEYKDRMAISGDKEGKISPAIENCFPGMPISQQKAIVNGVVTALFGKALAETNVRQKIALYIWLAPQEVAEGAKKIIRACDDTALEVRNIWQIVSEGITS